MTCGSRSADQGALSHPHLPSPQLDRMGPSVMATTNSNLAAMYQGLPPSGPSFLSRLGNVVGFGVLICLTVAIVWGFSKPTPVDKAAEAERVRRARIEERADRAYADWREECERLERHLTPAERAIIADEKDSQEAIERAGRAGRRLGEALRNR